MIKVGVLELQGDFGLHHKILQELGYDSYSVKESADLESLDGLIIPGGESTTMSLLIDSFNLRKSILDFSKENPILGTCAGLILMANDLKEDIPNPLSLMNINVSRNAYGRQIDSFKDLINFSFDTENPFPGVFIRAPKILNIDENVDVICTLNDGEIVGVKQGKKLGTSFHPELTTDNRFHKYFIDLVYS